MNSYLLKKNKILVVCKNNYARGPLVEKVLEKRFPKISKKLKLFNSPEPDNSIYVNHNMSDDNIELVMKNLLFFSLIWADYFNLGKS